MELHSLFPEHSWSHPTKAMEDPRSMLRGLLNKNMKIQLSDGRVLVGMFLCTDKEANVILVRKSSIKDGPQFLTPFIPKGLVLLSHIF